MSLIRGGVLWDVCGTVCEDAPGLRRQPEALTCCTCSPEASISLASVLPISTDLTFLQSKVSQMWVLNLVQILVLLPPA